MKEKQLGVTLKPFLLKIYALNFLKSLPMEQNYKDLS
jgi:hypothetical protein